MDENNTPRQSTMNFYVNRLAEGDPTYQEKLCQRLADRLLFLPFQAEESNTNQNQVTVKAQTIVTSNGLRAVPAFSTKSQIQDWSTTQSVDIEHISVLGADICKVLEPNLWLVIDPESEGELLIHPDIIKAIADYGEQQMLLEFGEDPNTQIIQVPQELQPPLKTGKIIGSASKQTAQPQSQAVTPPKNIGLRNWLGVKEE